MSTTHAGQQNRTTYLGLTLNLNTFRKISYFFHKRLERKKQTNKERKRKKEEQRTKERKKERKRAKTLKSAHLWLLLIVINLTYTRIGFVSLI